ncbi:hypothetical protein PHYBLDRAFT_141381 [Phycomyces blakesleeanus NRRL 1555(-)]|uniref:Uncharacterized protein n=1 Tax=Phycomyces blakesleeanus (strain ATCC 8743b / DSM 1359 / FGSC 10004 / NBRC 33097 / NRRL 1555) TaxID=763407 RepID=A0A167P919_PHYB8|nr:hypothetical protein PHYBLDRAFT_141381 [Phycomyces blakesleeanus NRRL 1555(-)]OAD77494.1 hypothetical protein PHYBLDRAFT_141381 [Phycomyces blakesleeanus NRRL 1555(-)]|eukprot:XP_018295534.1 hypothetical protein PHYBLDRAFT_141381 [Phycomyces blakesleeanus NRRL 1555(-)]
MNVVMVGVRLWKSVGPLVLLEGNMNASQYAKAFKEHFVELYDGLPWQANYRRKTMGDFTRMEHNHSRRLLQTLY